MVTTVVVPVPGKPGSGSNSGRERDRKSEKEKERQKPGSNQGPRDKKERGSCFFVAENRDRTVAERETKKERRGNAANANLDRIRTERQKREI